MKAKEFCQKYNLGGDSSWIMRKYANHDLSLEGWFSLVHGDLVEIPKALSQAIATEKEKKAISSAEPITDEVQEMSEKPTRAGGKKENR